MSYLNDFVGPYFTSAGPVNLQDLNRLGKAVTARGRAFVYCPPIPWKRKTDAPHVDA